MFRSLSLLAVTSTAVTAATIEEQCQTGLQDLQRQSLSDDELAIRCRAGFSPKVCKAFRQAVGPQPWSNERVGESCSRFAALAVPEGDRELQIDFDLFGLLMQLPLDTVVNGKDTASSQVTDIAPRAQVLDQTTVGKPETTTAAERHDETTKEEEPSDANATAPGATIKAALDKVSDLAALPVKPTNSVGLYAEAAAPLGMAMIAIAALVARRRSSALMTPETLEERASLQEGETE